MLMIISDIVITTLFLQLKIIKLSIEKQWRLHKDVAVSQASLLICKSLAW